MYVTSRGAPRTGLPFVLPVSFDKIDNNNNKKITNGYGASLSSYVGTWNFELLSSNFG